jgi:hypothetical protein
MGIVLDRFNKIRHPALRQRILWGRVM